jgi:peptidoglycan hydrolase-like protein with peptidoglycan-binding domain
VPVLKGSVGEGGANAAHDVALIQVMLRVVKNAKGAVYFNNAYTGTYDAATKAAVIAFQTDQKLASAPGAKLDPAAAAKLDKTGFIDKGSATLKALSQALPADYKEVLIIEGTKTVYLPMAEASAKASAAAIQAKADLDPVFRGKVANLVTEMYAKHKIVLSIPGDGWNRNFAAQAVPAKAGTGANPGESNHQYGKAVDIGFDGLRWVAGDGQINKPDNFWLSKAGMPADKQKAFWEARNRIAFNALGLFKTNKVGDLIHLQAYKDDHVSYGRSLAALLQAVSPNGMKWSVDLANPNQYRSDFGLGGAPYKAGSALQIWGGQATVSKPDLVKALNAKLAVDKAFSVDKFFGVPMPVAPQAKPGAKPPAPIILKDVDIKDAYLATMKTRLKGEFQAADQNRGKWKPLP